MTAHLPTGPDSTRGRIMSGEMAEQPAVLRRLLDEGAPRIREIAARIARARPALRAADRAGHLRQRGAVREVPDRGPARQAGRPHLDVHHHRLRRHARPDRRAGHHGQPVRRLARPGRPPPRRPGRPARSPWRSPTTPDSPLAEVSEFHIDVLAGPEKALPATKTYTAELLALYLFVEGLRGGDGAAAKVLPDAGRADPGPAGRGQGAGRPLPVRRAAGHHLARLRLSDRARRPRSS